MDIRTQKQYLMTAADISLTNLRVFLNYIYELKKGIRRMALFTTSARHRSFIENRLESQDMDFVVQEVNTFNINVYFGARECIDVVRCIVDRPLNELSPEADFMLGAMLGYDIRVQCLRYCGRKSACAP